MLLRAAVWVAFLVGLFLSVTYSNRQVLPLTSGAPEARVKACATKADVASSAGPGGGGASGGGGTISILAMTDPGVRTAYRAWQVRAPAGASFPDCCRSTGG